MVCSPPTLWTVFKGWDDYQISLERAIEPLLGEQLAFRPASHLRSVGQIAAHICVGRVSWFLRMGAPASAELASQMGPDESEDALAADSSRLVYWIQASWEMIRQTLESWTVEDLAQTYREVYQGRTYEISRQWTLWRILAHDLHHGGELALALGILGVALPELGDLGGHLSVPALANSP